MSIKPANPILKYSLMAVTLMLILAACSAQELEVTRVVEQEVEVDGGEVLEVRVVLEAVAPDS